MPIAKNCPECGRLAYMTGGVCEFCGFGQAARSFEVQHAVGIVAERLDYTQKWTAAVTFVFEGPKDREQAFKKASEIARAIGRDTRVVSLTEGRRDVELVQWQR